MRSPRTLTRLLLIAGLALLPAAAGADVVLFPEGRFVRVDAYEIVGDRVHLTLPNGGKMTVRLVRIDRILKEETVHVPPPEPPAFRLRFDASQPRPATPFGDLIYEAAERHALNPALVAAVVRAESAFDPRAVSVKGAQGLMQLMPSTADRFGLEPHEVFEPAKNLDAGSRYLSWLAEHFEERLSWVLAAYNAGEGTVRRYEGVPPYRETRDYLRRIYTVLGLQDGELAAASTGR